MLYLYSLLSMATFNSVKEMQKTSQICKECQLAGIKTWLYKLGWENLKDIAVYSAGAFYNLKSCVWKLWITEYVGYFVTRICFPFSRLGTLKTHRSEEVGKMGMFIFQSGNVLGRYYPFPATGQFYNPSNWRFFLNNQQLYSFCLFLHIENGLSLPFPKTLLETL